jgi:3-hydroxy-9,10-secoandrosta-1,3,5(10)-triene-9,17-dione monooxygenase
LTALTSNSLDAGSDIVDAARSLQPVLRRYAEFGDTHRRAADEVIEALHDARMFRLFTPEQFGGLEVDLMTALEVTSALGEADGSAAWLVGVAASSAWALSHGSTDLVEEVFGADPDARIAGGAAGSGTGRPAAGGRIVSGQWSYASGCRHAAWAAVLTTLTDGDTSVPAMAVIPMADVEVADTWHTSGLRGTGSNTIIADEVFVPAHRLLPMDGFYDGQSLSRLYRLPFLMVGRIAISGSLLGVGSAALRFVIDAAANKAISHTSLGSQRESVAVQLRVADAAMRLQTANLHVRSVAAAATDQTRSDDPVDRTTEARLNAQIGHAVHEIVAAADLALDVHGSGGRATASPLRRMVDDIAIGARHAGFRTDVGNELFGKALLGLTDPPH